MTAPTVETVQAIQTAQSAHTGRPASAPAVLKGTALAAYFAALTAAVERDDPGPSAGAGWEERERLYVGAWVRRVYEHPLSPLVFTQPHGRLALDVQHAQAAALARRIDVGRGRARPAKPAAEVRAVAAIAAMWAVTASSFTQTPRPPRERVVSDAWAVVRSTIGPSLVSDAPTLVRLRGAW
ncbi:hypothetical protein [Streptomyces liangshanensis]|uniref:hypothetical protein n=1 Tax=Streptomyces liangshanensis TaxID=2717324 RepID=UPI0036DA79B2